MRNTQKNFLFFEGPDHELYAIVSIQPHRIYHVDSTNGFMTPHISQVPAVENLGYSSSLYLSLSSGPIALPSGPGKSLVVGHVSVGGWGSGTGEGDEVQRKPCEYVTQPYN